MSLVALVGRGDFNFSVPFASYVIWRSQFIVPEPSVKSVYLMYPHDGSSGNWVGLAQDLFLYGLAQDIYRGKLI